MAVTAYDRSAMSQSSRTGRLKGPAGLAALIGVLALLAQALLPAAALAATAAGARQVELCSSDGGEVIAVDRHGTPVAPFAGLPCFDCVGAVTAATVPPQPAVVPVVYAASVHFVRPAGRHLRPPVRAPPRPPSRAPPPHTI